MTTLQALIPFAVPAALAVAKAYLPRVPKKTWPTLAPLLGAAADVLASGAVTQNTALCAALGSAGVGLRELVKQYRPKAAAVTTCLVISVAAIATSGCKSGVPASRLKLGNATWELPKNTIASNLVVEVATNGTLRLKADWLKSENEPSVITASGEADAARLNAILTGTANIGGQVVGQAVDAAIRSREAAAPAEETPRKRKTRKAAAPE